MKQQVLDRGAATYRCVVWSAGILACVSGCATLTEAEAIEAFVTAVQQADLGALQANTSPSFRQRALRDPQVTEDLKLLRIPAGEVTLLDVRDVSETEKLVTAAIGERQRKVRFRLVRADDGSRWVVDEVFLKQTHGGVTAVKSVGEQLDLLMSVRDILRAWSQGSREEVLAAVMPSVAQLLDRLPPSYLAWLTEHAVGPAPKLMSIRPAVQLDDNVAIVKLPRAHGQLIMSLRRDEQRWLLSDLALESRDASAHIPSLRKLAAVLVAAAGFLDAYQAENKPQLARFCTESLFRGSLQPADLSLVRLPPPVIPPENFEVHLQGSSADVLVSQDQVVTKLTLRRVQDDAATNDALPQYLVEEVTLYELDTGQQKRLSAVFTAHAMVQIFAEGLSQRDLGLLRHASTLDFNQRVWLRADESRLERLPLEAFQQPPRIVTTVFQGAVTEVTVQLADRAATFRLQDHEGRVLVDDVLLPVRSRPSSLKKVLELAITIQEFALALQDGAIDTVRRVSSRDFNRLVWHQLDQVPPHPTSIVQTLLRPVGQVRLWRDTATAVVGNDTFGARVRFVAEAGTHVIDDVVLVAGPAPDQQVSLKAQLREYVTTRRPVRDRPSRIVVVPTPESDRVNTTTADGDRPFAGTRADETSGPLERPPRGGFSGPSALPPSVPPQSEPRP
ncbi:MAG: hypothetical protein D6725_09930 [Planctomycetota bacterium]|nr:MAG: hypothetical protein D6725_09930 [Planctomycetota bacterium]